MIIWLIAAFVFGALIPYMARRFAKFMPATFAGAIFELCRPEKKLSIYRQNALYKKFLWRSFMSGLLTLTLTFIALSQFSFSVMLIIYIWILLLLAEIDIRSFILPDILTIPLLLLGITASYLGKSHILIDESIYGALVGYFLPVVVSLLIVWYKKDAFGGGDIKLLSAIGSWLGVEGLLYVITSAAILGLLWALFKKKKSLAFGPMLSLSGIIILFFIRF